MKMQYILGITEYCFWELLSDAVHNVLRFDKYT
jgi:hypothetical protein